MINSLSISLNAHSSSMNSIELVLDVIWCSWWSLSTACCLRVAVALSYRWSWYFYFGSWPGYQILSLITAWLEHKTLILFLIVGHFILNWCGINWLPGIFGSRLNLTILYHSVNNLLIISTTWSIAAFPLTILLVHQSHRKLSDIDWMIWILHHNTVGVFCCSIRILWLLDWSKSSTLHFVVTSISIINSISSSWRYTAHLFSSCINSSITNIFLLNWLMNSLKHSITVVWATIRVGCIWEETAFISSTVLVLCSVKRRIFLLTSLILGSSSTSSDTSYMSSISCITILTFNGLHYRIIKVYYKIIIDSVFIRRFWLSNRLCVPAVSATSLGSSMECSDSFVWWCILLLLFINWTMLDCLIVKWVFSILLLSLDWWPNKLIEDFPSIFDLFRV